MSQTDWDKYFLQHARTTATKSKDPSTKVGAVIVDQYHRIISTGFNGFPAGMEDQPEWYSDREEKYKRIIHAEMNALLFAERSLRSCTLYVYPLPPCSRCMVHIIQAGISRIVTVPPTPDILTRWGKDFDLVQTFAQETKVDLIMLDLEDYLP